MKSERKRKLKLVDNDPGSKPIRKETKSISKEEKDLTESLFSIQQDDFDFSESSGEADQGSSKKTAQWSDDHDGEGPLRMIPLDTKTRLKKLKRTQEETSVSLNEYETRLRSQFARLHNQDLQWAQLPRSEEDTSSTIQSSATSFLHSSSSTTTKLSPDILDIARVNDANKGHGPFGPISCLCFHPSPHIPLLLSTTPKGTGSFSLFTISHDGMNNSHAFSRTLKDLPVLSAQFCHRSTEVLLAGRRHFFYSHDLTTSKTKRIANLSIHGLDEKVVWSKLEVSNTNKYLALLTGNPLQGRFSNGHAQGYVAILSLDSKLIINTIRCNGPVCDVKFTQNDDHMLTFTSHGQVALWDLRTFRCIDSFSDQGSVGGTCFALAKSQRYLGTGDTSGIVNVYSNADTALSNFSHVDTTTPHKVAKNLTTSIDCIKFNGDSQLLAFSSRKKLDSFKILHIPSGGRVYKNWPTARTPLDYVSCFDFSPQSNFLAIGNKKGKVLLYKLSYYS